jgi:hypothetical protein
MIAAGIGLWLGKQYICEMWDGNHYWVSSLGARSPVVAGVRASKFPVGADLTVRTDVYVSEDGSPE